MSYLRPDYLDPGIKTEKTRDLFGNVLPEIPKFTKPITPIENFRRVAARQAPLWVPNSLSDFHNLLFQDLAVGEQIGPDLSLKATQDYDFYDWFGVPLRWCVSAGGATNKPGTHLLDDINKWEKTIKFPDLKAWDWQTKADAFMKNEYKTDKAVQIDLHNGLIQRLIAVLGGYTEGMFALSLEPEAVKDFFERLAIHMMELVDLLCSLYPVSLMTIHDDWGTEKDTFFSPKMMEELVFEPTKRIIDHIKSKGISFMLHSCGNITRFIPYMIDMNVDFLQIQRRAVDIPLMKIKYGDKIGFNTGIEGYVPGKVYSRNEIIHMVRKTVDIYGQGGGFYVNIFEREPETLWSIVSELFLYSREHYENLQH